MRVCIVGGGKVGYYLAKTLLEHGHTPVLIEDDPATVSYTHLDVYKRQIIR